MPCRSAEAAAALAAATLRAARVTANPVDVSTASDQGAEAGEGTKSGKKNKGKKGGKQKKSKASQESPLGVAFMASQQKQPLTAVLGARVDALAILETVAQVICHHPHYFWHTQHLLHVYV